MTGLAQFFSSHMFFESLGYIASALVFASFWMRTMIPLRVVAIASNFFFAAYGFFQEVYPPMILHLALLPLNVVRLHQMIELTRRVKSASRGDANLEWLTRYTTERDVSSGEVLFRKGDVADRLFVVVRGKFELRESGIVVAHGMLVGELGMLAPEGRRTQSLVCVEEGEVLELTYKVVTQLYYQNPTFGFYLLKLAAGRLFENIGRLEQELAKRPPAPEPNAA